MYSSFYDTDETGAPVALPDDEMEDLLHNLRSSRSRSRGSDPGQPRGGYSRYSPSLSSSFGDYCPVHNRKNSCSKNMLARRDTGDSGILGGSRRQSTHSDLLDRRLSEAGVNRRPSASQILTEDTDKFIVGQRVWVDGVKPGRIQYIGEAKFGPGDWAGVVLDEPFGRNDGSVGKTRYFQCEPYYGVFSRLFRLTTDPIDGADEVLEQMRKYGYEIIDAPIGRRGSVGSGGGSRRASASVDDRGSVSPRAGTPELRRASRTSPDHYGPRRTSLNVPERRGSMGNSPMGRKTPGRSPLASPRASRSYITGGDPKIEKDPDITKLTQEARRLSMGGNKNGSVATGAAARRSSGINDGDTRRLSPRTSSSSLRGANGVSPRRPSEGVAVGPQASPRLSNRRQSDLANGNSGGYSYRRESLGLPSSRRGSEDTRRMSNDMHDADADRRRLSEAGFRRHSSADVVLNEDTSNLRVGQEVWVDGNKQGRIAFIGNVQFAKGEVAGVHLHRPYGKNNGTVGGVMYFQCEPKHGIFARLHRLTIEPLIDEEDESYY